MKDDNMYTVSSMQAEKEGERKGRKQTEKCSQKKRKDKTHMKKKTTQAEQTNMS